MEKLRQGNRGIIFKNLNPHIFILVLNWNGYHVLKHCLESLDKIQYNNFDTIVIDNGSNDASCQMVFEKFPKVQLVKLEKNYGFSGGYNQVFQYLEKEKKPDYLMILNNDTIVKSDILNEFINAVKIYGNNKIYGAKIYYFDLPNRIWHAGGYIKLFMGLIYHRNNFLFHKNTAIDDIIVDYVTGCCIFVHWKTILNLNGFDENFNMYGEDVDFCVRGKKLSYESILVQSAILWHRVSASYGGHYSMRKWNKKQIAKIKLIRKHLDKKKWPIAALIFVLIFISELVLYFSLNIFQSIMAIIRYRK